MILTRATIGSVLVASVVRSLAAASFFSHMAKAYDDDEARELKHFKKTEKTNSAMSKLLDTKDFDPDDDDNTELEEEVLDTTIEALEADESSFYKSALFLLRELRSQSKKKTEIEYATYTSHPEFPDVDLSGAMKRMDGIPPINQLLRPRRIARVLARFKALRIGLRIVLDDVNNAKTKEEAYKAPFTKATIGRFGIIPNPKNFLPAPDVVGNWENDSEFARQFFCGVNPVMIEVAKDPLKQLSKNMIDYFGRGKLQELANKNQLLFVSYDDLAELKVNPHQMFPLPQNNASGPDGGPAPQIYPKYFYAPIIVFTYDYNNNNELEILGIQLERTDDARVYTKNGCGENEWLVVKSQVAAADSNMHQWVNHLGKTHLTMEPHIIAIYNTLRKAKHPLYTFLKQTSRDTLFWNWAARQTLAGYGAKAFGDYQSSVGVGQFMQLVGKMWSRYSFFEKSSLPNELASRGFTEDVNIPGYLFREDGMKLWNAIGSFATDFVDEIFDSDEAVASDEVVQEWAKETTDPDKGAVKGFPTSFNDKETVAKVLQTIMWNTSGLHAAINFPQYDFYGYVPNKPLFVQADLSTMPKDDAKIREWMFENMLPHINDDDEWLREAQNILPVLGSNNLASIDFLIPARVLTTPSKYCLDNLSDEFKTTGKKAYAKFLENLKVIGKEIDARNKEAKKARKPQYDYLHPSNVPASIDI